MSVRSIVVTTLALMSFLAGCSSPPPSGEITDLNSSIPFHAVAQIAIQEERKPLEEQAGEDLPEDLECAADNIPNRPELHCVPPMTSFVLEMHQFPETGGEGNYKAYLVGTSPQEDMGEFTANGTTLSLPYVIDEDLSSEGSGWDTIEIRLGDFVLGTAPIADGEQTFSLAAGVDAVSATGTYKGKTLEVTITGLPQNGTYTGHFYEEGEDGTTITSVENFPVTNGNNTLATEENVGKYVQFHIHVGSSKINLFTASIE